MAQVAAAHSFASRNMIPLITGLGISSITFSILTAQVWIYFWRHRIRSRENRQSKALAAGSPATRTITIRLLTVHMMEFDDKPHFYGYMSTDWALYTGICSFTMSLVHSIFIYILYGKWRITFVLIAFCAMEQVFGLLTAICNLHVSPIPSMSSCFVANLNDNFDYNITRIKWSTSITLGCSAINDVLIAGTLSYILYKHSKGVSPR
ncbi:hypothetical protein C8R48DRAFT_708611 [Suillus tomentosus]|nr:hypothetical protein C8R48DRAFT_708611 [Suillus tomentosus]